VGDEKDAGLTLAFNTQMKFAWDDFGITATLAFGASPQKCYIPAGGIAAVYSPELRVQLFTAVSEKNQAKDPLPPVTISRDADHGALGQGGKNVINVDFVHKKRLDKEEIDRGDS
jgi:hypothetical protein